MLELAENFPGKQLENICCCGKQKSISHIYNCEMLNDGNNPKLKYEEIYNGNLQVQIRIFERIEVNLKKCEQITEIEKDVDPCDPTVIRYLYSREPYSQV